MNNQNDAELPKIYLAAFPWAAGCSDVLGYALAEDGTGLCNHLSSSVTFSRHDLGLTSDWKHDIYDKHYPSGYQLIWIDNPGTHPGWQAALALNKERG